MRKVVWQWASNPHTDPNARMYMGVQKNPDGTGYVRLVIGDKPYACPYCGGSLIYKYPHSHNKADHERMQGKV